MKNLARKIICCTSAFALAAACGTAMVGCNNSSSDSSSSSSSSESTQAEASADTEAEAPEGQFVTVDWLHENLNNVCIVDARDAASYAAGHIPGAVNLHWTSVSNQSVEQGKAGWAELSSVEDIVAAAAAVGITTDKPIVVYTNVQSGWGEDGRIAWELKEAGAANVCQLDGGWTKWNGAGYEIEKSMVANDDQDAIKQVGTSYVKKHLKDAKIVDARAEAEYNGEITMGEAREGHIPGAISIPYVSLFNQDATILPEEELQKIFSDAGLSTDDEIIVYCTGGVRAAAVAEILEAQGYSKVEVYTAGFSEWAGDSSLDVEK